MKQQRNFQLLKWTLSFYSAFKIQFVFYLLCGGLMMACQLMFPQIVGDLIDKVIPTGQLTDLLTRLATLVVMIGILMVSKGLYEYIEVVIASGIMRNQQIGLLEKYQSLGFAYYELVPTGTVLSIMENAVSEVQKTYTFLVPQFVFNSVQFFIPSFLLLVQQPLFFLAAMAGNLVFVFLNQKTNHKIHTYLGLETGAAHDLQKRYYDTLEGRRELKNNGSGKWQINRTMDAYQSYIRPRMQSILWRHLRFTTVGLTLTLSMILFYTLGLNLIQTGQITLGHFVAYSFYMGLISRGFSVLFYIIPAQQHVLKYAEQVYDFMHEPQTLEDKGSERPDQCQNNHAPIISCHKVSFGYHKGHNILHQISLEIHKESKIAIVGESGCGKSTLLKLLGRLYDVDEGYITYKGISIDQLPLEDIRTEIGYVFQEPYLFNLTIRDNISRALSDKQIEEIAKMAGIHDFIADLPHGYETLVGHRGDALSGGQRQRIALARMLARDPQVILLDEATSALDNQTEEAIKKAISVFSKDKTLITVAHRLSTIMDYDHIFVMQKGQIVESGTYESLMEGQGIFYKMVMKGEFHER